MPKTLSHLSTLLSLDTKLDSDQSSEEQDEHSNPYNKRSQEGVESLDIPGSSKENEVIRLLRLIETNTSNIAHIKRNKKGAVERGRRSLEREMHIEALQNARNTIAIVAVLIASVSYAGGINPPGGVYDDGPWRGKSIVGNTTPFKVMIYIYINVSVAGGSLMLTVQYQGPAQIIPKCLPLQGPTLI
ncbi:unnamed protein product [Brassica oleracea var. botrytis]|uniref:PGG domain-containing protein n=3 Tax=Brassica TaxID=3705 RepID=A0A0D3C1K1_BRAOL|nr:unnamed protein product [Brassica napus]VDD12884.1 unnamed protein product [Brassica oleracea]